MGLNPVGVAVPFFFLLIGVERFIAYRTKRKLYRLNDSMTDIGCGVGDQVVGVLIKGLFFGIYVGVYEAFAIWKLGNALWVWIFAIVGVDLCYYLYHRFSHRTAIGWATHVVHHQSEEYNLAVALRQSWFGKFFSWVFYMPLAFIGVPPAIYAVSKSINLLYQFWIHTRLLGKLGPIEWIFNTPSHHRVHHGSDPKYLDRNYAGIFIVWDRMFGSFQVEEEEPVYGTLKPLRSWSPLWANIEPFVLLVKNSFAQRGVVKKMLAWIMPPGWSPGQKWDANDHFPPEGRDYDLDTSLKNKRYILLQFVPVVFITTTMMLFSNRMALILIIASCAIVIWTLVNIGAMFEGRPWVVATEFGRLGVLIAAGAAVSILVPEIRWVAVGLAAFSLFSVPFAPRAVAN